MEGLFEDYVVNTHTPSTVTWNTSAPVFTAEQQMKMDAVEKAAMLYGNKTAPNLGDYNEKFEQLYKKIYNFYVNNQELH